MSEQIINLILEFRGELGVLLLCIGIAFILHGIPIPFQNLLDFRRKTIVDANTDVNVEVDNKEVNANQEVKDKNE